MKRLAMLATVLSVATAAFAQLPSFNAEIDCDGIFQGGDGVPFLLAFENQTFEQKQLDLTVAIAIPGVGERTLAQRSMPLGPNQDRFINRQFNLPASAPTGSYQMSLTASDGTEMTFDTCSFNVVP